MVTLKVDALFISIYGGATFHFNLNRSLQKLAGSSFFFTFSINMQMKS